jgi:hypothetical protein
MACSNRIAKNITSNCTTQPVGGLEVEAYICNREDISPTFDSTNPNKITGLTMSGTTLMYKLTGISKNLNAGHDRVISDDFADTFTHYFSFKGFEFDSASAINMDTMSDVVVFVNYKNKNSTGDGVIVGYGVKTGLYISSDSRRANDNNGVRTIELTSKDNLTEPYSQYNLLITDYATTLAALEALLS